MTVVMFCLHYKHQQQQQQQQQKQQHTHTHTHPSATAMSVPGLPHFRGFTLTLRHTTLGRTPLGE